MTAFQRRGPIIAHPNTCANFARPVVVSQFVARRAPKGPLSWRHVNFRVASTLLHQRHRHSHGHVAPPNHHRPYQQWCVSCTPLWGFDLTSVAHRLCCCSDAASIFQRCCLTPPLLSSQLSSSGECGGAGLPAIRPSRTAATTLLPAAATSAAAVRR